ncbi:MAG: hypothetical protein PW843_28410 [Azospirillaceae bacterium]|nr:hypothetical protein [Azospirillaceae bacterium]
MFSRAAVVVTLATGILFGAYGAQAAPDPVPMTGEMVVLYYHKKSGEWLDLDQAAGWSRSVSGVSAFDRPAAQKKEVDRLKAEQAQLGESTPLEIDLNIGLGEYDVAAGQYTISAFTSGHYLKQAFHGQNYQVGFQNGSAFAFKVPVDEARKLFNERISAAVVGHFAGVGDPNGALDSFHTVLFAIDKITLKKSDGKVLMEYTPTAVSTGPAVVATGDWNVSGLKLGMTESELTSTAKASFPDAKKLIMGGPGSDNECGGGALMTVMNAPTVGAVCVLYKLGNGKATSVIVRQVLSNASKASVDEVRKGLIAKYGVPPAAANGRSFGWGPSASRLPKDYQLSASVDEIQTYTQRDMGDAGVLVLSVTLIDQATLQAKTPVQEKTAGPHL